VDLAYIRQVEVGIQYGDEEFWPSRTNYRCGRGRSWVWVTNAGSERLINCLRALLLGNRQENVYRERETRLLPPMDPREHIRVTGFALKNWAVAQVQDSIAVALLWLLGLSILKVPWAPLWAALAAALQIVPHLGPVPSGRPGASRPSLPFAAGQGSYPNASRTLVCLTRLGVDDC
jgi:hypothetical protein